MLCIRNLPAKCSSHVAYGFALNRNLINLDFARKKYIIVSHQVISNLIKDPPSGLIRDPKLALQLLGEHSATGARHKESCAESLPRAPQTQPLRQDPDELAGQTLAEL